MPNFIEPKSLFSQMAFVVNNSQELLIQISITAKFIEGLLSLLSLHFALSHHGEFYFVYPDLTVLKKGKQRQDGDVFSMFFQELRHHIPFLFF